MPPPRTLEAREAARLLAPVDTLAVPLGPGQPQSFLHALGERDDWEELRVFGALLVGLFQVFTQPGVELRSGFFGPVERGLRAAGHRVHFVPADFRRFRPAIERTPPRVMATAASPPDERGRVSLSLHAGATVEELHRCARDPDRLLIVETHAGMPRTYGLEPDHPHALHLDEIDVLVPGTHAPLVLPDSQPTAVDRRIAEHVRRFVPDGATLQTGIGAVPDVVAGLLAEGDGGDYGIHTEMFTNGLMELHRSGKITNAKGLHDGLSIATFAMGSRALYDWLHENESVRFLPVDAVNAPDVIARNRRFISINSALAIDLAGQIVADTLVGRQYSGIGGHEDFLAGTGEQLEDRSLVCLPSTAVVGGEAQTRIVAQLPPGSIVTTPRHQLDVVVTEYGAAELFGRTTEERREALIRVAHPDWREALAAAPQLG